MLVSAAAALLLLVPRATAQPLDAQPFETVALDVGATWHIYSRPLISNWQAWPGGQLAASMPFYRGQVEGGVMTAWQGPRTSVPGFLGSWVFVGWMMQATLPRDIRVRLGPRVGNFFMYFPEEQASFHRLESELALGLSLRLCRPVGERWQVTAALHGMRVFTSQHISMAVLSLSVSRSFATSAWLRDMLD